MAIRIAGVDVPPHKHIWTSLTYIYGIGKKNALDICTACKIEPTTKASTLSEEQLNLIRDYIKKNYLTEGDLRTEIISHIKRLDEINCYRAQRRRKGLPAKQKTYRNARTAKKLLRKSK